MKLDQSMVGKKVRMNYWSKEQFLVPEIMWGQWVLGKDEHGLERCFQVTEEYYFKIIEEPKLPSERITEIIGNRATGATMGGQSVTEQAIIQYLDEEAKKK